MATSCRGVPTIRPSLGHWQGGRGSEGHDQGRPPCASGSQIARLRLPHFADADRHPSLGQQQELAHDGDQRHLTVGVDISKAHLDAHRLRAGEAARLGNDAAGFKELLRWSARRTARVCDVLCASRRAAMAGIGPGGAKSA